MRHMKRHVTTIDTGKRAYACEYCKVRGHTQGDCPDLLSGNQKVKPAKGLIAGEHLVYETTEISNERIKLYPACNLNDYPLELFPGSATPVSIAEHSLYESITATEIKEEHTTWVPPEVPPNKDSSCVLSQIQRAIQEETSSELATKYNATDENYTATLQQNIDSSANCSVKRCRGERVFKIFDQIYKEVIGTADESNHTFIHRGPIGHLDFVALSQSNQKPVKVPAHTIDSKSYLQQLKFTPKAPPSSDCDPECIGLSGHNQLIDCLLTYLNTDPGLKRVLPFFRLTPKTLGYTEKHQLISYQNIPDAFTITLESLRSLITSDGVNMSFSLMENYYGLLREKFPPTKSDVMISNLKAVQCIYQVSNTFQALQGSEQSFTKDLFRHML